MSEALWRIWRHKHNPQIRYYVEMEPTPSLEWHASLAMRRYHHGSRKSPTAVYKQIPTLRHPGLVRLRSTRNLLHDDTDYAPHVAPEAGMWPRGEFEALYEPEEGAA